ncbi:MAG: hypothetical protein ABSG03_29695 [Bryobacteraceae bacterium]
MHRELLDTIRAVHAGQKRVRFGVNDVMSGMNSRSIRRPGTATWTFGAVDSHSILSNGACRNRRLHYRRLGSHESVWAEQMFTIIVLGTPAIFVYLPKTNPRWGSALKEI